MSQTLLSVSGFFNVLHKGTSISVSLISFPFKTFSVLFGRLNLPARFPVQSTHHVLHHISYAAVARRPSRHTVDVAGQVPALSRSQSVQAFSLSASGCTGICWRRIVGGEGRGRPCAEKAAGGWLPLKSIGRAKFASLIRLLRLF